MLLHADQLGFSSCCLVAMFMLGCGKSMPPPAVPDPQWLKTPEAKEYARKALAAVEKKDEEAVRTLTNQVRKKMTQAIQKGAGLMDNDYGMIMGSLENAQSGGWEQAEKNLRDLLTYSEDQEKKSQ